MISDVSIIFGTVPVQNVGYNDAHSKDWASQTWSHFAAQGRGGSLFLCRVDTKARSGVYLAESKVLLFTTCVLGKSLT